LLVLEFTGFDVVDGARSRHRSAIGLLRRRRIRTQTRAGNLRLCGLPTTACGAIRS